MAQKKCKKGKIRYNGTCVSKREKKIFGKLADEYSNLKIVIIGAISALGSYLIYLSLKAPLMKLFDIDRVHPVILFVVGVIIIASTYFIKRNN